MPSADVRIKSVGCFIFCCMSYLPLLCRQAAVRISFVLLLFCCTSSPPRRVLVAVRINVCLLSGCRLDAVRRSFECRLVDAVWRLSACRLVSVFLTAIRTTVKPPLDVVRLAPGSIRREEIRIAIFEISRLELSLGLSRIGLASTPKSFHQFHSVAWYQMIYFL